MNKRGIALIASYMVIAVLTILGTAFISRAISEGNLAQRFVKSTQAFWLAEAGIHRAIFELNHGDGNWAGWNEDTYGNKNISETLGTGQIGDYYIEVKDPTGTNPIVESIGYVPNQASAEAQRIVEVRLKTRYLFSMAAFGRDGVSLDSNARTDSYDSRLGPYGGGNVGSDGDIGTNATSSTPPAISLDSNVTVNGDAVIGPGGDPSTAISIDRNVTITGEKKAGSEVTPPSITGPTDLTHKGAINLGGNNSQVISASGEYSSITLDSNSTLTIDSDATIYITGGLELNSNSQIIIANGADVEIYVDGSIRLDSNTQVNNLSQDPTKLTLYGTDSLTDQPGGEPGIDFDSNSNFYGAILSPNAGIGVDSNAKIFGSVFAKRVTLDSNATIHYDKALEDSGPSSGYAIAIWREK